MPCGGLPIRRPRFDLKRGLVAMAPVRAFVGFFARGMPPEGVQDHH